MSELNNIFNKSPIATLGAGYIHLPTEEEKAAEVKRANDPVEKTTDYLVGAEGFDPVAVIHGKESGYTVGHGTMFLKGKDGKWNVPVPAGMKMNASQAREAVRGRVQDETIPLLEQYDPYWADKNVYQQAAVAQNVYRKGPGIFTAMKADGSGLRFQKFVDSLSSPDWQTEIPKAMDAETSSDPNIAKGFAARKKSSIDLFNKDPESK